MLVLILTGLGLLILVGINTYKLGIQRRENLVEGRASTLGNWAWLLSTVSLLVPYLAPISLIMAGLGLRKMAKENKSDHFLRPSRMALANSTWALMTLIAILGLFLVR